MIELNFCNNSVAAFLSRELLGILFLFYGYDKIFNLKLSNVIETVLPSYQKFNIPIFIVRAIVYFTSYTEFIGGILLIIGFFKYAALYLLGVDLILVATGLSLLSPLWSTEHFWPRFMLLIFLLLLPESTDTISLDNLLTL